MSINLAGTYTATTNAATATTNNIAMGTGHVKAISDDIRDVYAESKANGFDVKALRTIVRLRKIEPTEREEQDAILETYMHALGMLKA